MLSIFIAPAILSISIRKRLHIWQKPGIPKLCGVNLAMDLSIAKQSFVRCMTKTKKERRELEGETVPKHVDSTKQPAFSIPELFLFSEIHLF